MYRGKYKICWTRDFETRDKFGRRATIKEERFSYRNTQEGVIAFVKTALRFGCYDIWIEEAKDDGRDHENY